MTETESTTHLGTDAAEQASLRRVAVLAARGTSYDEVFAAVVDELERLLGVETARLIALEPDGTRAESPLGQRAERTVDAFSDLLATAALAAHERASAERLIEQQRALRQVATLAARGVATAELFAAVTRAAGEVLDADIAALGRFGPDNSVEYVANWRKSGEPVHAPGRRSLEGDNLTTLVARTGRSARLDRYATASGELAELAHDLKAAAGVGVPVIVEGHLWGSMNIFSTAPEPLPPDTESRLNSFTELLGSAIANAGTRDGLALLADQQAALRRVATLVAKGAPDEEVYAAVTIEAGLHLEADFASLSRIDDPDWMTTLATWRRSGDPIPPARWTLSEESISTAVARTGRPVRRDDYGTAVGPLAELIRSVGAGQGVAVPVIMDHGVWGVMAAFSAADRRLPADTEQRLTEFTALLAMAIANTESRQKLAASRARIVATADQARRQIERDLHDGAQQRLVSLGLELQGALAATPAQLTDLRDALSAIAQGLSEAQHGLREIAHGVHPAVLAATGLGPALKSLARRSSLPVTLDVEVTRRLSEQVEVAAYYVVKEALDNAGKHAQAQSVKVRATLVDDVLRINVSDDGIGGADPSAGTGLIGLKDRVETLLGTFKVRSPEGAGTDLAAEIPVASA